LLISTTVLPPRGCAPTRHGIGLPLTLPN
jgi:hypothetical protein